MYPALLGPPVSQGLPPLMDFLARGFQEFPSCVRDLKNQAKIRRRKGLVVTVLEVEPDLGTPWGGRAHFPHKIQGTLGPLCVCVPGRPLPLGIGFQAGLGNHRGGGVCRGRWESRQAPQERHYLNLNLKGRWNFQNLITCSHEQWSMSRV